MSVLREYIFEARPWTTYKVSAASTKEAEALVRRAASGSFSPHVRVVRSVLETDDALMLAAIDGQDCDLAGNVLCDEPLRYDEQREALDLSAPREALEVGKIKDYVGEAKAELEASKARHRTLDEEGESNG